MKKYIWLLCTLLLLCGCNNSENSEHVDIQNINEFDFEDSSVFDFDVHSQEYVLIRLSDFKVLNSLDTSKIIYPASLTKIMTLNIVLHKVNNLQDTSYITREQILDLIYQESSLAGLKADYPYTMEELLYALILPSGGDGAIAISNYFTDHNMDIMEEIAKQLKVLGCNNTNFVNPIGLHDDKHYTTIDDLLKIIMDTLSFEKGRQVLQTLYYRMSDESFMRSSLSVLQKSNYSILGGKTGYTPESGQSVMVLFRHNNRSYLLMVCNAMGQPRYDQFYHYEDALEIMEHLY